MAVDESYMPGQNDTNKKFYPVRAIEIETTPSVGIGESHTPIMESTVSKYRIADLYKFVKGYDKDFTPAPEISPFLLNEDGTPMLLLLYHTQHVFSTYIYLFYKRPYRFLVLFRLRLHSKSLMAG